MNDAINNSDEMHRRIVAYAGENYAKPKRVEVAGLDLLDEDFSSIDDAIEQLVVFKNKYASINIDCEFERGGYEEYGKAEFKAYRFETPDEVEKRVDGYRQYVRQCEAKRRQQYEQMKREFEINE